MGKRDVQQQRGFNNFDSITRQELKMVMLKLVVQKVKSKKQALVQNSLLMHIPEVSILLDYFFETINGPIQNFDKSFSIFKGTHLKILHPSYLAHPIKHGYFLSSFLFLNDGLIQMVEFAKQIKGSDVGERLLEGGPIDGCRNWAVYNVVQGDQCGVRIIQLLKWCVQSQQHLIIWDVSSCYCICQSFSQLALINGLFYIVYLQRGSQKSHLLKLPKTWALVK